MSEVPDFPQPNVSPVSRAFASFFNQVHALDGHVLRQLLAVRVPCSTPLAEHRTVEVRHEPDGTFTVGMLGLLNGLLGYLGGLQPLVADLDMPDGQPTDSAQAVMQTGKLVGFRPQRPSPGEPGDMHCHTCHMRVDRITVDWQAVPCGHDNTPEGRERVLQQPWVCECGHVTTMSRQGPNQPCPLGHDSHFVPLWEASGATRSPLQLPPPLRHFVVRRDDVPAEALEALRRKLDEDLTADMTPILGSDTVSQAPPHPLPAPQVEEYELTSRWEEGGMAVHSSSAGARAYLFIGKGLWQEATAMDSPERLAALAQALAKALVHAQSPRGADLRLLKAVEPLLPQLEAKEVALRLSTASPMVGQPLEVWTELLAALRAAQHQGVERLLRAGEAYAELPAGYLELFLEMARTGQHVRLSPQEARAVARALLPRPPEKPVHFGMFFGGPPACGEASGTLSTGWGEATCVRCLRELLEKTIEERTHARDMLAEVRAAWRAVSDDARRAREQSVTSGTNHGMETLVLVHKPLLEGVEAALRKPLARQHPDTVRLHAIALRGGDAQVAQVLARVRFQAGVYQAGPEQLASAVAFAVRDHLLAMEDA